jgi:cell division protein FtsB
MNNIWSTIFKVSIAVVIIVTVIGVLYIYVPEYTRMSSLQQKKDDLLAKNQTLESQIHTYQNKQNLFQNEPNFVERLVREQFGMVKEHETIYKVIHDSPPAPGPSVQAPSAR